MYKPNNPYLIPLVLVTSLFFLWGFAHSMLDVLNKHFQEALHISKGQSGFIQLTVFGAYFLMALPAGLLMRKVGYRWGIITGLCLYAAGAFLFYPATIIKTFGFFLFALFVIASGLAILETAANPYITILGDSDRATQRLNLSQSFNGLGAILGPLVGGFIIFNVKAGEVSNTSSLQLPYMVIGIVVVGVALLFFRTPLPEVPENASALLSRELFSKPHFVAGVAAQFFYVGAQVCVWSYFINYATEVVPGMSNQDASFYLSGALVLFMVGRFAGTSIMQFVSPSRLLAIYAMINIGLSIVVIRHLGIYSVYAIMAMSFFMSIMFPTIFALTIKGLGDLTKQASSYIVMSIVGGAVFPPLLGYIADLHGTPIGYCIPMICFVYVLWFARFRNS